MYGWLFKQLEPGAQRGRIIGLWGFLRRFSAISG